MARPTRKCSPWNNKRRLVLAFEDLKPGMRIKFLRPAGMSMEGREYQITVGKIAIHAGTHVVVDAGGRFGTALVVKPDMIF